VQLAEKLNMPEAEAAKYGLFLKRRTGQVSIIRNNAHLQERLLGDDDLIMAEMAMDEKLSELEKDNMNHADELRRRSSSYNPSFQTNTAWDPSVTEVVWFKKINMFIRVTVDTPSHDYKGFKAIPFDRETKVSQVISAMCEKLNLSSTEASAHGL